MRDEQVEIPVVVEVAGGQPAARGTLVEAGAGLAGRIAEERRRTSAAILGQQVQLLVGAHELRVAIDLWVDMAVRDDQVEIAVVVEIDGRRAPRERTVRHRSDAGLA